MTAEFDFDFDEISGRGAYRTKIPGLKVSFQEQNRQCDIADFSATGLSFMADGQTFREGGSLVVDLMLNDKVFLRSVPMQIVRILQAGTVIACTFQISDRRMEAMLDKFVLEVQKRMIATKKQQKN